MIAETPPIQSLVEAFIAVGSNIDPQENILRALLALKKYMAITGVSNFYQTKAVGASDQPDFLNGVIKVRTYRGPRTLKFEVLRNVEAKLGRVRCADKFAARTIDLDMILYGTVVMDEPDLILPDPAIRTYPFVAVPLLELAPDLILPDTCTPLWAQRSANLKTDLLPQPEFTDRLRQFILT
jgi:2-amino-4-hydroxy-6-hydroxymethyldihydropteridine diphosphokinase